MTKKILPFFVTLIALISACNNSSKSSNNPNDTGSNNMTHESMDHKMDSNIPVPELPAIPEGARVFFKNLKEGEKISSPFKLEMGVDKIRIDTAGPVVAGSGHHHLFINSTDSLLAGTIVPKDSSHIHFGKGQTEYELSLKPGKYKLTLQLADGLHRSYGSRLATTVNISVQ